MRLCCCLGLENGGLIIGGVCITASVIAMFICISIMAVGSNFTVGGKPFDISRHNYVLLVAFSWGLVVSVMLTWGILHEFHWCLMPFLITAIFLFIVNLIDSIINLKNLKPIVIPEVLHLILLLYVILVIIFLFMEMRAGQELRKEQQEKKRRPVT